MEKDKDTFKIGDEHIELEESIDLENSQIRLKNEQVIQPYYHVIQQCDCLSQCKFLTLFISILMGTP